MKNRKTNSNIVSIVSALAGLALILWPKASLNTVCRLAGGGLILSAAVVAFVSWKGNQAEKGMRQTFEFGACAAAAIAGILVLSLPGMIRTFIPRIIGIILILNGGFNLMQTNELKKIQYGKWNISLVLAVLTLVFGLIMLFSPRTFGDLMIRALGVFLVYNGISNLWVSSKFQSDLTTPIDVL